MRTWRQPVPWAYEDVVKLYINEQHKVLDIGTGGGGQLNKLANNFKIGLGTDIDEQMIKIANSSKPNNVSYKVAGIDLKGIGGKFDIILNRHAPFDLAAIEKHLNTGGYFITQQVGELNMDNIILALGGVARPTVISRKEFNKTNLKVVAFLEYNVDYRVEDIESLIFWLSALDILHAGFDATIGSVDAEALNKVLESNRDNSKGYLTNEHRYLVVAQKNAGQVKKVSPFKVLFRVI